MLKEKIVQRSREVNIFEFKMEDEWINEWMNIGDEWWNTRWDYACLGKYGGVDIRG